MFVTYAQTDTAHLLLKISIIAKNQQCAPVRDPKLKAQQQILTTAKVMQKLNEHSDK